MTTKVYDADQISIVLGGIPISGGYADGEFLTIEQEENDFNIVVGTDGEVTRSKSLTRQAKITINLMQSASSNALLSALNQLDISTANGGGIVPFICKDRQGTSLYFGPQAWIEKPPDVKFDRTATPRSWTIRVGSLQRLDGGN